MKSWCTQSTYWLTTDWSSPRSWRIVARASGVASGPASVATGSPGTSRITANTRIEARNEHQQRRRDATQEVAGHPSALREVGLAEVDLLALGPGDVVQPRRVGDLAWRSRDSSIRNRLSRKSWLILSYDAIASGLVPSGIFHAASAWSA